MEEKQITLQIDRHYITVPEGSTILEAARKIGIDIPTLCHIDLKGTCVKNNPASCRICVVEVEGRRNLAPACATRCTEGMVVRTSTLRVMNARKVVAELILSDHPNDCLTCPKCGNCELQTLALRFNIRRMPYNGGELSPRKREVTSSIVRNMDKCIFCRRCESVCNEVQTPAEKTPDVRRSADTAFLSRNRGVRPVPFGSVGGSALSFCCLLQWPAARNPYKKAGPGLLFLLFLNYLWCCNDIFYLSERSAGLSGFGCVRRVGTFVHDEKTTAFCCASRPRAAPAGAGRQGAGRRRCEGRPETDVVQHPLLQARRRRRQRLGCAARRLPDFPATMLQGNYVQPQMM